MTTTYPTSTAPVTETRRPVWRAGLAVSAAAAAIITVLAAAASAAGVSFAGETGESIPLLGFTQLTFVFSLVGVGLAAVLARRARRPRSTFVRTTVALTVLSCVPDVMVGFDALSAVTLMALHVVAAAIVIPVLAGRLATTR
ncbi:hypothetical protein KUV85_07120 [Nocardioides panacisoli]|uniref:DUF6069 family protein n=1 Tax=Nocardioides panacisoli TaxID=627624 RepID=UPI001C62920A|nr:DUF6069 family protein [Nocardioides panacisoli]QYJ05445.1 hypothetical protein KUV85_07120 [Nocardioides panacisoli]